MASRQHFYNDDEDDDDDQKSEAEADTHLRTLFFDVDSIEEPLTPALPPTDTLKEAVTLKPTVYSFEPPDIELVAPFMPPSTSKDEEASSEMHVPIHPIPSMQNAFAESMQEANLNPSSPKAKPGKAAVRRQILIDQDIDEETHAARWRQKPDQKYHQLWKLMSQISFGIYLLLNGIARDDEQVMNILQGHVDEVDEFLELTLEDFDLAQDDIDERLKFLKLPLQNIIIFDAMLEDRQFRLQIVSGNERIEHVIHRTATAMNDALKDVQHGLDACKEFTMYLAGAQEDPVWRRNNPDMEKVYQAMKGNVDGWYKAYVSLQTKGNHLGVALVQLGSIVAEMDKRAGEISRKTRFSNSPQSSLASPPVSPPQRRVSREMRKSMLKTLPSDPNLITPAIRATLPAFAMVSERERTPEPDSRGSSLSPKVGREAETEPEEEYFLAPTTYTPVPSPKPPSPRHVPVSMPVQAPIVEESVQESPAPEIKQRSSLRNRFSLKRRSSQQEAAKAPAPKPPQEVKPRPRPQLSPVHSDFESRRPERPSYHTSMSAPQQRTTIVRNPNTLRAPLSTPPSRGMDSAYCSDYSEKPFSPPLGPHPALNSHPMNHSSHIRIPTPPIANHELPMGSPRSDREQYFRPVIASPHSPLQRPWTAAPPNHRHVHTSSNLSNLSGLSSHSTERPTTSNTKLRLQYSAQNTPSQSNLRDRSREAEYNDSRRGELQSRMGMSMMSDTTMVTENGKKVKKKRSAFGWLKKAFALSEEEKAAFEQRRRMPTVDQGREYYEPPAQRWVDGKRVGQPSPVRSEFSRRR